MLIAFGSIASHIAEQTSLHKLLINSIIQIDTAALFVNFDYLASILRSMHIGVTWRLPQRHAHCIQCMYGGGTY